MHYVLATFGGVLVLIIGIYWVFVARPESRQRGRIERRLTPAPPPAATRTRGTLVKAEERLSAVGALDALLQRTAHVSRGLQLIITRADVSISVGTLVLTCAVVGMAAWLIAAWVSGLWWLGLAVAPLAGYVPVAVVRQKAAQRVLKFEEQFPDALDLVSRALRAGHAFTTGLAMVAEEAPQPAASEFRVLYEQQNFGMPMPDAMRAFAQRIPLLDARFFVTAVLTQRDAGGNLAEVLDNLASVIRERFKVKRQVRVVTAHARATGWVLSLMPPGLALGLLVIAPGHIMVLVHDPLGVKMIIAAAAMQVAGTLIIRHLVDIEY